MFFDFETRSVVNLKKAGVDLYARHPTTDALCLAYAINDGPTELWTLGDPAPLDIFWALKDGARLIAHNAQFDLQIWNGVGHRKYGWPEITPAQVECTMVRSYAMALPGSLENAGAAVGLSIQKDMAGHRVMLQLAQPRLGPSPECVDCSGRGWHSEWGDSLLCSCVEWWEPRPDMKEKERLWIEEKYQALYSYATSDIASMRELYFRLLDLSPFERRVWELDQKINLRGIRIDTRNARRAIQLLESEKEALNAEMHALTNGSVPSCQAVARLKSWIEDFGLAVPSLAKADVVDLLKMKDLPAQVIRALELRQLAGKSSTAKLQAMVLSTSEDGYARGCFQYYGAPATGRWSGKRIQLQNLPRPALSQKEVNGVFSVLEEVPEWHGTIDA